jgi:CheY-like chemotaxis protein
MSDIIGERKKAMEALLVEDSPGDVRLTQDASRGANRAICLPAAYDGIEATAFLRREMQIDAPRSNLDLSLPRMDGRKVLRHIKGNDSLQTIPIIILATSDAEVDILKSHQLKADCYLTKPVGLDAFESVLKSMNDFWPEKLKFPQNRPST